MPGRLTKLMLTLAVLGGAHAAVGSVPTYTTGVAPILLMKTVQTVGTRCP
jgi:hypothetical protein